METIVSWYVSTNIVYDFDVPNTELVFVSVNTTSSYGSISIRSERFVIFDI